MSARIRIVAVVFAFVAAACSNDLATVTPVSELPPSRTIDIPIDPPPGSNRPPGVSSVAPLEILAVESYREPAGLFSLDIPVGWIPQPQGVASGDVRVGTLFQAPEGNGLLTVTQFDNGQQPATLGATVNQILELTGVTKLAGYQELSRTNVLDRPEEALKVELAYTRSDGVPMHSLVLFQVDGTAFSMVNSAVEAGSWSDNVSLIHDILATYKVPAVPSG